MHLLGCGVGKRGTSPWMLALLLPVKNHETLGYLLLSYTPQTGCLKTIGVVLKSCLGEIPCFTPAKAHCILLDEFLKCGLQQKFRT